jgi:hypothetical protein
MSKLGPAGMRLIFAALASEINRSKIISSSRGQAETVAKLRLSRYKLTNGFQESG